MDDLELLQPKTLKEKIIHWTSFVLGVVGMSALLWHIIRVKP
jgi:hypothetical protein